MEALERVHRFVALVDERELPDGTLTSRYRFVHVLYQNALYGQLRAMRRVALSAAVAETLSRLPRRPRRRDCHRVGGVV